MNEWTPKDFRKAAFAVGFGLTLGKYFGGIVDNIAGAIINTTLKKSAEKGNKYAQNACRDLEIEYEKRNWKTMIPRFKWVFMVKKIRRLKHDVFSFCV